MNKYKFFTNFDEEENWLNDMARQGYRFTKKTSLGYKFEPDKPVNATIRIDCRTFGKREDFENYCALFEDSGWEHIAGTKRSGYQYFKKADKQGSEDIFSDIDSKAGRYKRMSAMWAMLAFTYFPLLVVLILTDMIDPGALVQPKMLYYTSGLWDLTGTAFWRAFLFETPFALFRGILWSFFPVMIMIYLYFVYKANNQYKKTRE